MTRRGGTHKGGEPAQTKGAGGETMGFDEYTLEYLRSGKTDGEKREDPDDGKPPREAARPRSGDAGKKKKNGHKGQ